MSIHLLLRAEKCFVVVSCFVFVVVITERVIRKAALCWEKCPTDFKRLLELSKCAQIEALQIYDFVILL